VSIPEKEQSKTENIERTNFYLSNLQIMSIFFFSSSKLKNTVIINMLSSPEQISGFQSG
jgi:hypothetical protein